MAKKQQAPKYLICVQNDDYPVSLELRKIYQSVPDIEAGKLGFVRIVDESGEDYLYPEELFVPVRLSKDAVRAFAEAS